MGTSPTYHGSGPGGTGCSSRSLGFRLLMGSPGAGGSSSLGFGSGSLTNGAISGARGAQVVASEDLTRAMVFTPIATAASGLTTIFALATWASRGNRSMELVSRVTICDATSDGTGHDHHVSRHGCLILDRLCYQHGRIRKGQAGCRRTPIIYTIKPESRICLWSCYLLALGSSGKSSINRASQSLRIVRSL